MECQKKNVVKQERNDNLLEIKNLSVEYRTEEAIFRSVNNISFSLRKGETLGLVGETGAGKTTTALSILRLLPERTGFVSSGQILYKNEDLLEKSLEEMRNIRGNNISMIFQDPMSALNPLMKVGDQIREVLKIHNHTAKSKDTLDLRVDEIFQLVGIPARRKNDYPNQFSGGMKQRVVIAMALACSPELILADEPTTALDVTIQAQVLELMRELKEKLRTSIILITHDLGVVANMCDKVAIMYAGEIVEMGPIRDIFSAGPHHPYTEGLFASIPDLNAKSKRLNPIDGLMPDPASLPDGCHFHPRCKHCTEQCMREHPKSYVFEDHMISCHLYAKGGAFSE